MLEQLNGDVKKRSFKWKKILKENSGKVYRKFDEYCSKTDKAGEVVFHHKQKTTNLHCVIDNTKSTSEANDVKNLSETSAPSQPSLSY